MSRIIKAYSPLAAADFSWVNQGTATADDACGAIKMYAPSAGGAYTFRALQKSATRPFSLKGHLSMYSTSANCWAGIHFSATSTSTNWYCVSSTGDGTIRVDQYYENAGSYIHSGLLGSSSNAFWNINNIWLKIDATSTATAWYASADGENWTSIYSTGAISTISHAGIFVDPYNSAIYTQFDSFELVTL